MARIGSVSKHSICSPWTNTSQATSEQSHSPDPAFITETVGAACVTLRWGTLRWLMLGGHDPDLLLQAQHDVFKRMPKKE